MKQRKILVTGGAGMIGSNLVKKLVENGDDVFVVDNLWRGKLSNLQTEGRYCINIENRFYNRDLSVPGSIDDIISQVDFVVHLADIVAGIGYVFNNQGYIFRQNVLINSNVFTSIRNSSHKIEGVMYVGTACSFPRELQSSFEAALLEESQLYPANPESAYGWSKLMGQFELGILGEEKNIKTLSLIFHNVYGSPADYSERGQVIPSLIARVLKNPNEPLTVWGTGKQGRAFVHVDDVVRAILLALDNGWNQGPIQIGPDKCTTIAEVAAAVIKVSGLQNTIIYDTTKPEGDLARAANYAKAKSILGWEPRVSLEEGIGELYSWIQNDMQKENAE
jgi:GDP-D-mannose 3',5'-epimerase